ncbi:MAG TPA: DUF1453 domain-containing protein [Gammaproteobacteria bacterium]|nr:DUF1453 domain-containing protein [Gammaproteobacteria bacterium]
MHLDASNIGFTLLIAAAILFILYRRFRRNLGRQKLRPKRMILRIVVLAIICVVVLASPFRSLQSDAAAAGGAVIGIALGLWALAHTKFGSTADGRFYTPNGYIGMIVVALFLGRLIYRFIVIYSLAHHAVQQAVQNPQLQSNPFAAYQHSPMTVGLYFLLAGYYICYYVLVIIRSREAQIAQDDDKPKLLS